MGDYSFCISFVSQENMKMEYTIISIIVLVFVVFVDIFVLKTKIVLNPLYRIYLPFIFIFFFVANQYLTCRPVVLYEEIFTLGFRVGCVPLEDFIFNISLVTLPIILWTAFSRRNE